MLVDIFSSFDDHNSVFMSLYILIWMMTLTILSTFNMMFWAGPNRWNFVLNLPKSVMASLVMRSFGVKLGGFINIMCSLFLLLILFNLLGLVPYVFSPTSHFAMTLSLGCPFWLSLIISGSLHNPTSVIASLLPAGAPAGLNPILVLVETASICIRPITLSVRLAANITAGHIVLGLIGTYLSSGLFIYSVIALSLLIFIQIMYFIFEFGIALIQAYIFSLLITLYSDEHPSQ
uniref:ATP synthase subunit a n=1 Tax=Entemnotrochus rumphii TaxID=160018 RepID=A0A9E8G3U9_9VEST|nr:ATP synthase F0 subunit 6 [Entemnotrochus rumphii]UZT27093.1 ATP synthase F0 subunit 6 [Entemnotrochus rumphii]